MGGMGSLPDLSAIARKHGRFPVEAYAFVGEGLRHAAKRLGREDASGAGRHLTAKELVEGVLDLAASQFGMLARLVLRSWNLRRSEDIGAVTFHLIECGIFGKQPSDRLEDFEDGPGFATTLHELVASRVIEQLGGDPRAARRPRRRSRATTRRSRAEDESRADG